MNSTPPAQPHKPRMAIIAKNTLTAVGMRTILENIIPFAEVCIFNTYDEFAAAQPDSFAHCFIDTQTFVEHSADFAARSSRTILLTAAAQPPHADSMACINIAGSEEQIVRDILRLHQHGHAHGHPAYDSSAVKAALTPREGEVLAMIARGMLNKQIADRMGIALTTVISHRKHITEKLGTRSVPALTIYAVTHGYIDAEAI